MSYQIDSWSFRDSSTGGCSNNGDYYQGTACDDLYLSTQDTAAGTGVRMGFQDGRHYRIHFQPIGVAFNGGVPSRPCEDDRPLTKDSWYCPECKHLHGRRHYKNWKDGPPYCPHCKWEGKSWNEIEFLPQEEIDRLNRERGWTRDD